MQLLLVVIALLSLVQGAFSLAQKAQVLSAFTSGNALKVISGLNNFDAQSVKDVCWAAGQGGASHVDIACSPELVAVARAACPHLPIIVSSVVPQDFVAAVEAGADMVELGNFDSFYEAGKVFTAEDVISMTIETRRLLPSTPISVTVPHTLSLDEQVSLAVRLQACGVDVIQTEGKTSAVHNAVLSRGNVRELVELASPTLASAFALSRAVTIPVMCASGLTDVTASMALAAGAKGVGIGSAVNKLKTPQQMLLAVSAIAASMGRSAVPASSSSSSSMQNEQQMQQSLVTSLRSLSFNSNN